MTLRTASKVDLSALRFVDPLMRADRDRADLIETAVVNGKCVVAADSADVMGFAVVGEGFFGQGFVPLLVVAAANRRQGVGTLLLGEAERRCGKTKLFVSCNRSNLPAQWLFEKCGFERSGQISNLDPGDEELVFFKPLTPAAQS